MQLNRFDESMFKLNRQLACNALLHHKNNI